MLGVEKWEACLKGVSEGKEGMLGVRRRKGKPRQRRKKKSCMGQDNFPSYDMMEETGTDGFEVGGK